MNIPSDGYVITTVVALFAIMGILTLPPVFLAVTADMSKPDRRKIAIQTTIAVAVTIIVSYFVGEWILELFKINIDAFKVAGALVVGNMAWGMIVGRPSALLDTRGGNPSVIPLAIPKTAGPGAIALVISMGTADAGGKAVEDIIAIAAVTFLALLAMLAAAPIERVLGASGLNILGRIFGLILLAIAITSIMTSLLDFFPGWSA